MSRDAGEPGFLERYRRMFNRRGEDWWSIVCGYPVGRLLVLLVEPAAWITPTRLTLVGFACKLAAAALIWRGGLDAGGVIGLIALLQVGQVLDHMDGTLARARGQSSFTGAFLDKVTDGIGFSALALGAGWRATVDHGDPLWLALGGGAAASFGLVYYMYWIVRSVREPAQTAASMAAKAEAPPWPEIGREWLRGWLRIVRFGEIDTYLWISLFAALGQWRELVVLLFATQAFTAVYKIAAHLRYLGSRQGR